MATISVGLTTAPPYLVRAWPDTELFSEVETDILREVADGAEALESVLTRVRGDALGAVRHLIVEGHLELVAFTYHWGVEYGLELTESARGTLNGDQSRRCQGLEHGGGLTP